MNTLTFQDIVAVSPEIERYIQRLHPKRGVRGNPYQRYEQAKHYLIPLIPDLPGAYEIVIRKVLRRLRL